MDIRATLKLCRGTECARQDRHWVLLLNDAPCRVIYRGSQGAALDMARQFLTFGRLYELTYTP